MEPKGIHIIKRGEILSDKNAEKTFSFTEKTMHNQR